MDAERKPLRLPSPADAPAYTASWGFILDMPVSDNELRDAARRLESERQMASQASTSTKAARLRLVPAHEKHLAILQNFAAARTKRSAAWGANDISLISL